MMNMSMRYSYNYKTPTIAEIMSGYIVDPDKMAAKNIRPRRVGQGLTRSQIIQLNADEFLIDVGDHSWCDT